MDPRTEPTLRTRSSEVARFLGVRSWSKSLFESMKARGTAWFAIVTTVAEARAAEQAGADVAVAQGAVSGGHRGRFDASKAEREAVGLFALLPAVVDAVTIPVVATGGIADARGIAAALTLGASAVQIGTGFLRCPRAPCSPAPSAAERDEALQPRMLGQRRRGLRPRPTPCSGR